MNIGAIQVARIDAAAHRVSHDGMGEPYIAVALQMRGEAELIQAARRTSLPAQHWSVCNAAAAFELVCGPQCIRYVLLVPRPRIDAQIDLTASMLRTFSCAQGAGKLLAVLVEALIREAPRLTRAVAAWASEALLAALNCALLQHGSSAWSTSRTPLSVRIRAYIESHARDPQLSIQTMEKALAVSRSKLIRAARSDGFSIGQLIRVVRLEGARRDLESQHHRSSIRQIALAWGFGNSSHFSHAFRAHFGVPPRAARASATQPKIKRRRSAR